jgi:hypothetical protein
VPILPRTAGLRARPPATAALARETGQAAVELVTLFPLLIALAALAWQLAVAGHAAWAATAAARVAARAHAVGDDATTAARTRLPAPLAGGVRVKSDDDGTVEVAVRIPAVLGLLDLGDATGRAHFEPQE